ncbi:MAG: recombinase family protein [Candidatus Dormibacter sp.]
MEIASRSPNGSCPVCWWPTFAPVGYINVAGPDGKRALVVDEERAPLVAQTFEWYASGELSVKGVAQRARAAGLAFRKSGRPISTAKVHQMLRQRMYCGEFEWAGKLYRGRYPPIISLQLCDKVQEVLDDRHAARPKVRTHHFTFSGLLVCSRCGCAVVGEIKKRRYGYYRCTGNRGICEERTHYVREEVLIERFGAVLQAMAIEPHILAWVARALRSGHDDEKRFRDDAIARLDVSHGRG